MNSWDECFSATEWIEWDLVKTGDSWTLSIYSDSKVYKTYTDLTGNTLRELFFNKFPNMMSGQIGNAADFIWTTEVRAK